MVRHGSGKIRKQRIGYAALGITLLLFVLIVRLGWIQLSANHKLSNGRTLREMSVIQRQEGLSIDTGRGQFTDKQGRPLTGSVVWTPMLFPDADGVATRNGEQLAKLLHTDKNKLLAQWQQLNSPLLWRNDQGAPYRLEPEAANQLVKLAPHIVELVPYMERYPGGANGRQWMGFLYERPDRPSQLPAGGAGLERTLEPLLAGVGETVASRLVDARRRPLAHSSLRIHSPSNANYPLQIQTTIDLNIQRKVEELTEKNHMAEGAVVVLDAGNADILSMVSRPFYHPSHVDPKQPEWSNRAVKATAPGSIFKLVTAAAALEAGAVRPEEKFHCHGAYGKYGLACWKQEGHGTLNWEEGLAVSCNVVFAQLAERLTSSQMEAAANALGLGRTVGWEGDNIAGMKLFRPLDHEEKGAIFGSLTTKEDEGVRVQTAIGQRDVQVTPLQAANMIVTLLHHGEVHAPRLVRTIRYADGRTMRNLEAHAAPGIYGHIHASTTRALLAAMERVVAHGTGASLQRAKWHLSGKSGTAETLKSGQPVNNQWFIGYGPVERPRYAVAVLVQNAPKNSTNQATALFGQVMDELARLNQQAPPPGA